MKSRNIEKNGLTFTKVSNDNGLVVYFCSFGASIYQINYNRYVLTRNVYDLEDIKRSDIYYGKTIGRISNRFKGNKFKLNDEVYELEANEGENVLHGGPHGLSNVVFDVEIVQEEGYIDVIYSHLCLESQDKIPGDLDLKVTYRVFSNRNEIDVIYKGNVNKDSVISITNHTYFTLASKSLKGVSLKIDADRYLETDENLLPMEEKEVTPALDFREEKEILRDIEDESLHSDRLNGYDHYLYFTNKDLSLAKVVLSNEKIELQIKTNFEGVQIYTSGYKCPVGLHPYSEEPFDSIAIEPSDSFKKLHLLKKEITYNRIIKYIFNVKE